MVAQKEGAWTALVRSASRSRRRFGGYVVHLGIVAIIVAIAASSAFKIHNTGTLKVGQTLEVGGHLVRFDGLATGSEPHRTWIGANITVLYPGGRESVHHGLSSPRMSFYERQTDPVGSPAVDESILKDVYVSLLSFDRAANTASFNAWVFPLVGWIWYAIPLLVLGSLIAMWPQRKRQDEVAVAAAAVVPSGSP